jgi:hypothetical protein
MKIKKNWIVLLCLTFFYSLECSQFQPIANQIVKENISILNSLIGFTYNSTLFSEKTYTKQIENYTLSAITDDKGTS